MAIVNGKVYCYAIEGCDYSEAPFEAIKRMFEGVGEEFRFSKNFRIELTPEEETTFETAFSENGKSLESGIRSIIETVVAPGSFEYSYSELIFTATKV